MARRFLHHDAAFEHFLRERRLPYLAVDEARRTLLPTSAASPVPTSLKSFDFLVTLPDRRLLVEVKGRTWNARSTRLESWSTLDDVEALRTWQRLLGPSSLGTLVFLYTCPTEPPDTLFDEAFTFRSTWYGLRAVPINDYAARMRPRSERWRTVEVPTAAFTPLRVTLTSTPAIARSA